MMLNHFYNEIICNIHKMIAYFQGNSFVKMMGNLDADFIIAHPEGYALNPDITRGVKCFTDQEEAFENADFMNISLHIIPDICFKIYLLSFSINNNVRAIEQKNIEGPLQKKRPDFKKDNRIVLQE